MLFGIRLQPDYPLLPKLAYTASVILHQLDRFAAMSQCFFTKAPMALYYSSATLLFLLHSL